MPPTALALAAAAVTTIATLASGQLYIFHPLLGLLMAAALAATFVFSTYLFAVSRSLTGQSKLTSFTLSASCSSAPSPQPPSSGSSPS